jgi:hypothetical protein
MDDHPSVVESAKDAKEAVACAAGDVARATVGDGAAPAPADLLTPVAQTNSPSSGTSASQVRVMVIMGAGAATAAGGWCAAAALHVVCLREATTNQVRTGHLTHKHGGRLCREHGVCQVPGRGLPHALLIDARAVLILRSPAPAQTPDPAAGSSVNSLASLFQSGVKKGT